MHVPLAMHEDLHLYICMEMGIFVRTRTSSKYVRKTSDEPADVDK